MAWITHRFSRHGLFRIGPYRTEMLVTDLANFAALHPVALAPDLVAFEGETAYDAPAIELFGLDWEVGLNAVHGRIYKIALYRSTTIQAIAQADFRDVSAACTKQWGKWREPRQDLRLWAVADGYLALTSNAGAKQALEYFVDLFLTSREARDLPRASFPGIHPAREPVPEVPSAAGLDHSAKLDLAEINVDDVDFNKQDQNKQDSANVVLAKPDSEKTGSRESHSDDAIKSTPAELAGLRAVLAAIEGETGERPLYVDEDGRTFLHPRLAAELRKPGNGWLHNALRTMR